MTRSHLTATLVLAIVSAAGCATLGPPPPDQDASVRLAAGLAALDAGRYAESFDELVWVLASCPDRQAGLHARVALAALELDPRNPVSRPGVGAELLGELIQSPGTPDWLRPLSATAYLLALGLGAPAAADTAAPADEPAPAPAVVDEPHHPVAPEVPAAPAPDTGPVLPAADTRPPGEPVREPEDPVQAAGDPVQAAELTPVVTSRRPVFGCGPLLEKEPEVVAELPVLPGPSLAALLAETERDRDRVEELARAMESELDRLRLELAEARSELERIRRTLRP
jgi:hypothetical protein